MNQETLDKFIELKADGQRTLFFVQLEGLEFLFKPLTLDEYNSIVELENFLSGAVINDTLLRISIMHCGHRSGLEGWLNFSKAGHADFLAQAIIDKSGFQSQDQFLKILGEKRELANQVQSIMESYICTAFPSLRPSDIELMTMEEQLDLFAKAEKSIGKEVDFNDAAPPGHKADPRDPREDYPVPEGYQSADSGILSAAHADRPDWGRLDKGREVE
jgi:hypothetical protein